jgi:hypothetical protein
MTVHLDARSLSAGNFWTLITRYGRLDLLGEPAPRINYAVLVKRARTIHGQETYQVATIDDLIAMKRAAGRTKDMAQIELLRATADELAGLGKQLVTDDFTRAAARRTLENVEW